MTKRATRSLYAKLMYPNFASIMPQAIAVWAEQRGCKVHYWTFTGFENLRKQTARGIDILFICSFTSAAYLAYSISNLYRRRGVVTVLGGPHARAFADDAAHEFDYVLGFTDREQIDALLRDAEPQKGRALVLGARQQPASLPGVQERWKYVRATLDKASLYGVVPMLGSLGCPYRCSFCVDSEIPYQPLPYEQIRSDLAFLAHELPRPVVGWHDPNFAIRFEDYMGIIEDAVRPGTIRFVAESSLSLLSEDHLVRLQRNGFVGILVGIESWFGFNGKARQGARVGADKMRAVAAQVDCITRYIPFTQANFVLGLDEDGGEEPFDLTERFVDLAPAAYPAYSLFTAFGNSTPLNVELGRAGRILDAPFPLLDCASLLNVRPKNYGWHEFYDRVAGVLRHSYAPVRSWRRLARNPHRVPARWMSPIRSVTSRARVRYYDGLRDRLASDGQFRAFCDGQSSAVPHFLRHRIESDLGAFRDLLPPRIAARLRQRASKSCICVVDRVR